MTTYTATLKRGRLRNRSKIVELLRPKVQRWTGRDGWSYAVTVSSDRDWIEVVW